MADRRAQILLLYASRFDGLYLPSGSLQTPSGLVPAEREPCASCGGVLLRDDFGKEIKRAKGRGFVYDRYRRKQPCTSCGGHQDERGRWHGGEVARDPMDAQSVRVGSETTRATARPRRTVRCDACNGEGVRLQERCVYCGGAGRRDVHLFELAYTKPVSDADASSGDPMTDAVEARNASGSYEALERGLAGIVHHVNKPARFHELTREATTTLRLLDSLYLPPPVRAAESLSATEGRLVGLALDYLDWRMPDPIRVPGQVVANAKELRTRRTKAHGRGSHPNALAQRSREMQAHAKAGRSPQWIAAEYGLSVSTVYEHVNARRSA